MVGCGGRELRTDAPVGNHSEQVIGRHFTVASHVAEAGDWAWRVVAGCAFAKPCSMECKAVCLLSNHAFTIGTAGSWYWTYCGESVAPFVGIGARYLIGQIAAHQRIRQHGAAVLAVDPAAIVVGGVV